MCQWCREPLPERPFPGQVRLYLGRPYHDRCFEKLQLVAHRVGGLL